MSRISTNEKKREEIKAIVAECRRFWNTKELAALCGVTASAVSAWGRGKSMGTNHDRALLKALVEQPKNLPERIERICADLEVSGARHARQEEVFAAEVATGDYDVNYTWRLNYHRKGAESARERLAVIRSTNWTIQGRD